MVRLVVCAAKCCGSRHCVALPTAVGTCGDFVGLSALHQQRTRSNSASQSLMMNTPHTLETDSHGTEGATSWDWSAFSAVPNMSTFTRDRTVSLMVSPPAGGIPGANLQQISS